MKSIISGLIFTLAIPALAAAQNPDATPEQYVKARADTVLARGGDSSATARAITQFEALTQADPEQPLYRAYLGSMHCLKARDAWWPFSKMSHADTCADHLDKALRLLAPAHDRQRLAGVPAGLETRLVAASSFAAMPSFYNRAAESRQILADLFASPAFAGAPAGFRAACHLQAARMAQKDGAMAQGQDHLRKAVEIAPDSTAGKQAQALLDKPRA